jgi:D-alanyl-D-alanine carboxypeptidase
MLLGYTAGFGQWDEADQAATLLADLSRTFTPEEVLTKHLQAPPAGTPGSDPSFGRASYIAVGLLVQRLLDTDLATVIHDRFLAPLALDDTVFSDGTERPTRHGWLDLPGGSTGERASDVLDAPLQAVMSALWASEAMISSSSDLLDWGEALFSGRVLGPTGTATLLDMNPVSPPPVPNRYFGLGATGYCLQAGCDPDAAELVGAPGGGFCCWSTQLVYDRRSDTTIVVATNTNTPEPAQLIELPKAILAQL